MSTASRIIVERGVQVPMRDGCDLATDIWIPAGPGPFPAILLRTPYGRADVMGAMFNSGINPVDAMAAGFVAVLQDVRGRFDSGGAFRSFVNEAADGSQTMDWIRSQPWSDGSVSTYGASYFGVTALSAAAAGGAPAAVALFTSSDPHRWFYTDGAFELALALYWCADALARPELERCGTSRDSAADAIDGLLRDMPTAFSALPLIDSPVGDVVPDYREWLAHPTEDGYWESRSAFAGVGPVPMRVLHIAGWFDIFLGAGIRDYLALRSGAATESARNGQRLIIGPWAHAVPHDGVGECYFGPEAALGQRGVPAYILEFLRSSPADDEPRVSVFVMGENRWRTFSEWPPPEGGVMTWYLAGGGRANTSAGDGTLQPQPPPGQSPPEEFVYDPRDPVPTAGGAVFLPGLHANVRPGPRSQDLVESREDVLVFTSAPLQRDVVCVGPVSLTLWAASSARDTDWTARLVDVAPSGRTLGITDGILRCRYRDGAAPEWLEPGRPYEFTVNVGATGWVFPAGHRIRLQVSSSNFPRFDRNPNSTVDPALASYADLRPATQTVYHDATRPSRLTLSVVPADPRTDTGS